MQNTARLEEASWAAGAMRQIRLQGLTPGKRVRRVSLYAALSGTKDAADALDGDLFPEAISLVRLNSSEGLVCEAAGMELWRLQHCERGREIMDPTDIPGTGTTFSMPFQIDINFRQENQERADDGSISTEILNDHTLEITFASATVWGVGNLTVTAGTVYAIVEYADGQAVPQIVKTKYIDLASGLAMLEPGIYLSAILVQTDFSVLTQAELTMLGMTADGVPVHMANTLHEQLVTLWNQDCCQQSGSPHELAVNAAKFLPLTWLPRRNGYLSKQPAIEKKGEVRITSGSLTTPRLVVRYAVLKTEDQAAAIGLRTGAPDTTTTYEPAVGSKSPVRAMHRSARRGGRPNKKSRLLFAGLAGKMRTTPTVGSAPEGAVEANNPADTAA